MLQQYTEIVTSDIYPLSLHSDDFFDLLYGWLTKLGVLVYCSYIFYFMDRFSSGASQRAALWK